MWSYISLGYFKQRTVAGEVGSSTMPHKVCCTPQALLQGLSHGFAVFDHCSTSAVPACLLIVADLKPSSAEGVPQACLSRAPAPSQTLWL